MEKETMVLNVRKMPVDVVRHFKGRIAVLGLSMQDAVVLVFRAVADGKIKLEDLL